MILQRLLFLRRLTSFGLGTEPLVSLYCCTFESSLTECITVLLGNLTAQHLKLQQKTVKLSEHIQRPSARIFLTRNPSLSPAARQGLSPSALRDASQPPRTQLTLLTSGKLYWRITSGLPSSNDLYLSTHCIILHTVDNIPLLYFTSTALPLRLFANSSTLHHLFIAPLLFTHSYILLSCIALLVLNCITVCPFLSPTLQLWRKNFTVFLGKQVLFALKQWSPVSLSLVNCDTDLT